MNCVKLLKRRGPSPVGHICARTAAFASSCRAPEVSQVGAPCPDHLINTKHKPLVVEPDGDLADAFRRGADEYATWYRQYYERMYGAR